MIKIGEKYRHYKGGEYEVIGFAHHTETNEKMVLYKPLHRCEDLEAAYPDGVVFARPLSLFTESITLEGESVKRFSLLHNVDE